MASSIASASGIARFSISVPHRTGAQASQALCGSRQWQKRSSFKHRFYARMRHHWQASIAKPALDETVRKCASQLKKRLGRHLRLPNCRRIIV